MELGTRERVTLPLLMVAFAVLLWQWFLLFEHGRLPWLPQVRQAFKTQELKSPGVSPTQPRWVFKDYKLLDTQKVENHWIAAIKYHHVIYTLPVGASLPPLGRLSKATSKSAVFVSGKVKTKLRLPLDGEKHAALSKSQLSSLERNGFSSDESRLLHEAKNTYTIQLMMDRHLKDVDAFIHENHLEKCAQHFYAPASAGRHAHYWHNLVCGHYRTREEAEAILAALPPALQEWDPFVRRLSSVQHAIRVAHRHQHHHHRARC